MSINKKSENVRRYKLKTDRAKIKLNEITADYLPTDQSSAVWKAVQGAALARIDRLPDELMKAAQDHRSSPGEAQAELQRVVYATLTEIASRALVDMAVKQFKRARS